MESRLAVDIQTAYQKLVNAIDKETDTVRRTLAYHIGWGRLLLYWYHTENPQMPGEGFTKWDYKGLAEHFHKKYYYASLQEQLTFFQDVVSQIIDFVEKEHLTGNLYKTGVWSWCTLKSGKQWPLSKWVQVNTVAPYKRKFRESI